ncbi:hypothetical protein FHL15_001123 [Xylaria flabelliformis]|uniref:Uncharacterized protein n=1 Tax=Xylaria flabelliformis TaxID=2512241 RepID=A0A553ICJ2_9PEZI|nr:hypothetical protein FHL15_001123 [Xylaria flabelliformis]
MADRPHLPDFDIIETCLKELTTEIRFFQNLAPVEQATTRAALQNHVDILTKNLQSLSTFVKGLNQTVQGNKTASDNSIQAAQDELTHDFHEEMRSMKAYFQRAIDDCRVTKRDNKLRPLRNTTTHHVVMLPETLKELENLELEELDDILLELGQEPEYGDPERGDVELERTERVDQLKRFIGIEV